MNGPSVALAFPNMNNGPVLDHFFEKLKANTTYSNIEIVVVDDGSTDESLSILRRWRESGAFSSFKLVEQENRGVCHAFNRVLSMVESDLVVRLDGDATVETPGWLERMLAFYLSDEQIGIAVAQIVFPWGTVHSLGRNIVCPEGLHDRGATPTEPSGRRTLDSNVLRLPPEEVPVGLEISEVDSALGCCTMFSKALADEIGGLDPAYSPVWIEDDDFGFSARAIGKKVFCFPDVKVIHHVNARNPRDKRAVARRASSMEHRIGRMLPRRLKDVVKPRVGIRSSDTPWRIQLLRKHYTTWKEKWGFDPLNPDMAAVSARYSGSEICWASDPDRRRAGEAIIANYRATALA